MNKPASLVPEGIAQRFHLMRGHKVMLDADPASLHNVETRVLVQAVKRNSQRFPSGFMFRLTDEGWAALRSQFVTSKGRGGRRYAPYVFTGHGALMLSSVLDIDAIRQLMTPPEQSKRPIGFIVSGATSGKVNK